MADVISTELLARIVAEAKASPEVEVCGLLLGQGGRVKEARACRNVAPNPARNFEIDPVMLIAAHRAARAGGPAILGCYHSHPTGTAVPSTHDAGHAIEEWYWVIAAGDEVRVWQAVARGAVHDRFDAVVSTNRYCP